MTSPAEPSDEPGAGRPGGLPPGPGAPDTGPGHGEEQPVSARFLFRGVTRDAEFAELNDRIRDAAEENPGYRGREWWRNEDGDVSVVYWWVSLDALQAFARHPVHREAKERWEEWYDGYRVEVARLLRSYGPGL